MDDELAVEVIVHFHLDRNGLGFNAIGFANGGVRFEEAESVLKLDVKSIFLVEVAGMPHP